MKMRFKGPEKRTQERKLAWEGRENVEQESYKMVEQDFVFDHPKNVRPKKPLLQQPKTEIIEES